MKAAWREKQTRVEETLRKMGSVAVAFSGGVDSSLLLYLAHRVLGDQAVAVTVHSGCFPSREGEEAQAFAQRYGIRQTVVEIDELKINGFAQNPPNRCYLCKKELLRRIRQKADELGLSQVAEGSNWDDQGDYRPGRQAILEMDVQSPLLQAGLRKEEIRALSRELGLPTWEKPSFACLATRFPYGQLLTQEALHCVEQAEAFLQDKGFVQVRVRIHGEVARIEVEEEQLDALLRPDLRRLVCDKLRSFGFSYVSVDLQGYRTGSMNKTIQTEKEEHHASID